jgi:hypothetical protein
MRGKPRQQKVRTGQGRPPPATESERPQPSTQAKTASTEVDCPQSVGGAMNPDADHVVHRARTVVRGESKLASDEGGVSPVCVICAGALPPPALLGRPRRYCSTACRRSAELRIRRLQDRLAELEREQSELRIGLPVESILFLGHEGANQALEQEATRLRTALLTLLRAVEGEGPQKGNHEATN